MSKNRDFLDIRQLSHALCALCVLVHKVDFGRKRLSRPFFFLGGRKYGRVSKAAFYGGSVRKLGYSRLEYSVYFPSGGAFGRFCGLFCGGFANDLQIARLLCRRGKGILGGVEWAWCLIHLIHFAEKLCFAKCKNARVYRVCLLTGIRRKPCFLSFTFRAFWNFAKMRFLFFNFTKLAELTIKRKKTVYAVF